VPRATIMVLGGNHPGFVCLYFCHRHLEFIINKFFDRSCCSSHSSPNQSTAPDAYDDGANDNEGIKGRGHLMAAASSGHNQQSNLS
jgi:hypothetical protein